MSELLLGLLALVVAGALLYWLFVVGEGAYLGPWAVRTIYHFGAPHYDKVRGFPSNDDRRVLLPLLLQALVQHEAPRALDVATGTGRVPLLLATEGAAAEIIGLDLTPAMLDQARLNQARYCPHALLTWQQGEASRLPWPTGRFALVTCLEALEFFPQPRQAINEMSRVLLPGGTLLLSKYPDAWARALPGKGFTRVMLEQQLQQAGLKAIEFRPWQPGQYELVLAQKPVQEPNEPARLANR